MTMFDVDAVIGFMRMHGLYRDPSVKHCSRCNAKFNHRGAYCKDCHEKRKTEGKVGKVNA